MATILVYIAAVLVFGWGIAHAVPTRQVLVAFEPVTVDNHRVIVQEWLAEAFTMWGIAAVLVVATAVGGAQADSSVWIDRVAAVLLEALAVLTALTGARTSVIWFKICSVVLTGSAILLIVASLLR